VARDVESEHISAALDCGMGVIPWSPLAGGFLTGKYKREDTSGTGRLSGANPFGDSKFVERNWDILDVLNTIANECEVPTAHVALAWTLTRPGVTSTIIGASKLSQLENNIAATQVALSNEHLKRLNEVSVPAPGFSAALANPAIRRMVFGGHDVAGWWEQN
jgi:aryl-alcohol dehydrogenase-like predicted oxidoreductase